jgi:hypothetical protein
MRLALQKSNDSKRTSSGSMSIGTWPTLDRSDVVGGSLRSHFTRAVIPGVYRLRALRGFITQNRSPSHAKKYTLVGYFRNEDSVLTSYERSEPIGWNLVSVAGPLQLRLFIPLLPCPKPMLSRDSGNINGDDSEELTVRFESTIDDPYYL